MSGLANFFNPYDRFTKLYPMVLVLLPLGLGISAWIPPHVQIQGVLGSAIVVLALSSLLGQLARDEGKRREPELFYLWGGRPSDCALSYGAAVFPPPTLARRHRALTKLDPELKFPMSAEEEAGASDRFVPTYAAATDLLLANTRDRGTFPMLFRENMNYGYRRNLWGMKPAGLVSSLLGFAACAVRFGIDHAADRPPLYTAIAGGVVCVCLMVLWGFRITPSWVKLPSDAFARQLAEACDRVAATN